MKKLLTFALAIVMIFAMSVGAFADTVTTDSGISTQTVKGTLTKTPGSIPTASSKTVYVEISWTAGNNAISATGADFTWDGENCKYTTTGTPSASGSVVYTLNITNKSDCGIQYAVTYEAKEGSAFTTSLKSATTNSGSIGSAATTAPDTINTYSADAVLGEAQSSGNITITVDVTGIADASKVSTVKGTIELGTLTCTITAGSTPD